MIVTSTQIQLAQQEVDRLSAECQKSGAFAISRQQLDDSFKRTQATRASIRRTRGAIYLRAFRAFRGFFLQARLALAEASVKSGIAEELLGFCLAVLGFIATLLAFAPFGLSTNAALSTAASLFACYLLALIVLPRFLPATNAAALALRFKQQAETRRNSVAALEQHRRAADDEYSRLKGSWDQKEKYRVAKEYLDRLLEQFNDRKTRLLSVDWQNLRSTDFERFLVDVFEMLGYVVELTKASGDQGVDLLATKGTARFAIQAKGWAASVGNSAVQEAYAGMAFYGCNRCAVITNSEFTSGAVALAAKTGCMLIDGSQIPRLIAGQVL